MTPLTTPTFFWDFLVFIFVAPWMGVIKDNNFVDKPSPVFGGNVVGVGKYWHIIKLYNICTKINYIYVCLCVCVFLMFTPVVSNILFI